MDYINIWIIQMYINFNIETRVLTYSYFIMYNLRIITQIYYKYKYIIQYKTNGITCDLILKIFCSI